MILLYLCLWLLGDWRLLFSIHRKRVLKESDAEPPDLFTPLFFRLKHSRGYLKFETIYPSWGSVVSAFSALLARHRHTQRLKKTIVCESRSASLLISRCFPAHIHSLSYSPPAPWICSKSQAKLSAFGLTNQQSPHGRNGPPLRGPMHRQCTRC